MTTVALPQMTPSPTTTPAHIKKTADDFVTSFFTQFVQHMMAPVHEDHYEEEMFSTFYAEAIAAKIAQTYMGDNLRHNVARQLSSYQNDSQQVPHAVRKDF